MSVDRAAAPALARLRQARGQHESTVRWLYLLTPVILVAFAGPAALTPPGPGLAGRNLAVSIGAAGFVAGVLGRNGTARRPFAAAHVAFVALMLAASVTLAVAQPLGPGFCAVLLAVLCIARLLPVRAGVAVMAAAFVALEVLAAAGRDWGNLAALAVLTALYGLILLAFRLAEANKQAERLIAAQAESQAAQARAAALAERQHLAREMHDVLAHSLSGLMLQLEGARMLAGANPADPRLPAVIDRAHGLGKSGLAEARRAIGMLRGDELPGPESLPGLAAEFEQDRGTPCGLTVSGTPRPLGSDTRLALYRVAQEALTNIARHAGPDRVELHLAWTPSAARLTVEDFADVAGPRPAPAGESGAAAPAAPEHQAGPAGYGLTGMRERAELLGGTLITQLTSSGFRVQLDVPLPAVDGPGPEPGGPR